MVNENTSDWSATRIAQFAGLLCVCAWLGACKPPKVALTGSVSLHYRGANESSARFELINASDQIISLRGTRPPFSDTEPMDVDWYCHTSQETRYSDLDAPYGFRDGPYSVITVPPGDRIALKVSGAPVQYQHGRCRLRLTLWKGGTFESDEFEPL
jgi:hypothetical protein